MKNYGLRFNFINITNFLQRERRKSNTLVSFITYTTYEHIYIYNNNNLEL